MNTDEDKEEFRRLAQEFGVTWKNAWCGSTDAQWPNRWGIDSYPTIFVLDAEGVIRHVDARGEELERVVADLVEEAQKKGVESAGG